MSKLKLTNTRKALQEYDEQMPILEKELDIASKMKYGRRINEYCEEIMLKMDKLGEAVGIAYGEDTKDRNNPETCRQCIRPGPPVPGPGFELSFVRQMAAKKDEE